MRPLPAANNYRARTLTATVSLGHGPVMLAATSTPSGGTGDFRATSLSPSSTWQVGLQSGDFSWSYPLRVPPPIGGAAPSLALDYSSGATDGETAQSNSQPGQLGEGFSLAGGGFIEQKYAACADQIGTAANKTDQTAKTGDLCWDGWNAYLSLGGRSSAIIWDPAGKVWRLQNDDGSRVQLLQGSSGAANGAYNGEYWDITTTDGTQYIFGMNKLPGWASGDQATNSAWTVPVYGLTSGDPCFNASYAKAVCPNMPWRWNLDLVVDPNGNATEYFYSRQTNYYAQDSTATANGTPVSYTSGGTLTDIYYGSQDSASTSPAHDVYLHMPFHVLFLYADRCLYSATASQCASHAQAYWPDTPWDLYCATATGCTGAGHQSPAFFDTQMLALVNTSVWEGTTAGYQSVDTWLLNYQWLSSEVNSDLTLHTVQHLGLNDPSGNNDVPLPEVTLNWDGLINRVAGDGYPQMTRYRLNQITSETGAKTVIVYNPTPSCNTTVSPASNTQACFPQYWSPGGIGDQPLTSWFYKYTVAEVDVADATGGEPVMPTYYTYCNNLACDNPGTGAAWHYDTDIDLVLPKHKNYSQWRGYAYVHVITGDPSGTQSETDYVFFRGMNGDPVEPGNDGFTSATVTDSRGDTPTDYERANGFLLEKLVRDGPGGPVVSDQISQPWLSAATATSATQPWGGTLTAVIQGTTETDTYAPLSAHAGGTRHTEVANSYDSSTGLLVATDDKGDVTVPAQELCTNYSYPSPPSPAGLIDYPTEVKVTACGQSGPPLVSDARYIYDGQAWGTAPTAGNVTETQAYSAGDPGVADHWVAQSRNTYDSYGRVLTDENAASKTTKTSYASAYGAGNATTQVTVTDPLSHATMTSLDPGWGLPTQVTDPNGEITSYAYDPLGRVTSVWLPGQSQSANDPASYTYAYIISNTAPIPSPAITTSELISAPSKLYVTSYQILDSLLRPRQTQAPAEGQQGGAEVTDTFYDSRGNVAIRNGPYPISAAPSAKLYITTEPAVPDETASSYDGAGRLTESDLYSYNALQSKDTYSYPGIDVVTEIPPAGGTVTTTYTDGRGRTTEIDQYHSQTSATGPYDATLYSYDPAGHLTGVTNPAGTWTYSYDLLGRQISATDPDTGITASTYNDLSQLTSVTDQAGKTTSYTYDNNGRKTAEYDTTGGATPSGTNQLAAWTYDTPAVGQPATATQYYGGTSGATLTETISSYDPAYQPTSLSYAVNSGAAGSLNKTSWTFASAYNADGAVASQTYPAGGGLAAETVYHNYDNLGSPFSLWSGQSDYVQQSFYAPDGQPAEIDLGTSQSALWTALHYTYDPATSRLTDAKTAEQSGGTWVTSSDVGYLYDQAGNVTRVSDSVSGDTQCFQYDYVARLTAAWAQATATCPLTPPGAAGIGGPAPYQEVLGYDGMGNITSDSFTYSGSASDTTYGYAGSQPNAATAVTVNGTATSQAWTADGQLQTIGSGASQQSFSWDAQGKMESYTAGTQSVQYRYDAGGNLLFRNDNGTVTLYLPGEEITASGSTQTAVRYYSLGGQTVAARTPSGLSWLSSDPHSTDTIAVNPANQAVTQRLFTPFGSPRGTAPQSWPGDHGFVAGTTDTITGLTNLGAREYNPAQDTFISPDPLLNPYDPQDLNPYAYAADNPVSMSDPSGLCPDYGCPTGTGGSGGTSHNHGNPPGGCPSSQPGCPGYTGGTTAPTQTYGTGTDSSPGNGPRSTTTVRAPNWDSYVAAMIAAENQFQNRYGYTVDPSECTGSGGEVTVCGGKDMLDVIYLLQDMCAQHGITCTGLAASHSPLTAALIAGGGMILGAGRDGGIAAGGVSADELTNALSNWRSQRFQFGNQQFLLDRSDFTHILSRHMPQYWDGSLKSSQTFFDPSMSVSDVQDAVGSVLGQNRDTLISQGTNSIYQIQGSYEGADYILGINNGHITQFYPLP